MKRRVFKSSLTMKQIEKNFENIDFFSELKEGLEEAKEIASGTKPPSLVHKRTLPQISVVDTRKGLNMTQKSFASVLGVSPRTVEAWESGRSTPTPTAKKLMLLIQSDPSLVNRLR